MARVSTVWLEFWQMTFFFKNQLLFWYSFRNVWGVFSKFWIFKTKFPYFANTYSFNMDLWELFASRKEYFPTVITPLLLSLLKPHCTIEFFYLNLENWFFFQNYSTHVRVFIFKLVYKIRSAKRHGLAVSYYQQKWDRYNIQHVHKDSNPRREYFSRLGFKTLCTG